MQLLRHFVHILAENGWPLQNTAGWQRYLNLSILLESVCMYVCMPVSKDLLFLKINAIWHFMLVLVSIQMYQKTICLN